MRDILFRGKRLDNGQWVYGNLMQDEHFEGTYIGYLFGGEAHDIDAVRVKPDAVGQYTGLTDKNGVKIFEGDIIKCTTCYSYGYYPHDTTVQKEVKFVHGCFSPFEIHVWDCEVVGNIYDNPELLEAEI